MLTEGAAIGYAAVGAATLQGLVFLERLRRWQAARQVARSKAGSKLPDLSEFVDTRPDLAVAGVSTAFGALGGWLLSGEISGVPLALVAGAAAPELLAHILRSTPLMNALLNGAGARDSGSTESANREVSGVSGAPTLPSEQGVQ